MAGLCCCSDMKPAAALIGYRKLAAMLLQGTHVELSVTHHEWHLLSAPHS